MSAATIVVGGTKARVLALVNQLGEVLPSSAR